MNITGAARDQYLTALAKVIDTGAATSTASLEAAAQQVAADIGGVHNVAAKDLFELTPKHWLSDPTGSSSKREASSLLALSDVLQVPMATVSPIATRGVQNARNADLSILLNRADAVRGTTRPPEFLVEVDLLNTPPADVMKQMQALFAHPRFADVFGARDVRTQRSFFDTAARTAASIVADIQRGGAPGVAVISGSQGAVSGPAYEARLGKIGVIEGSLPQKISLSALASMTLSNLLVLQNVSEEALRRGVMNLDDNAPVAICGRRPENLFVLRGTVDDHGPAISLSFDDDVVRDFVPTNGSRDEIAAGLAKAFIAGRDDFMAYANASVPYGLIYDRQARTSPLIEQRVVAHEQRQKAAASSTPA